MKILPRTSLFALTLALVGATAVSGFGCRGWESDKPPVHLNWNMDSQEKGKSYRKSELFADGLTWLELALDLLESRSFPRSPLEDDCNYCSFRPVCGPGATDRSQEQLEAAPAGSPLARFLQLKRPQQAEEAA